MRQTQYYPFEGGENHSTPALSVKPGELISSLNYEVTENGYRRVDGFERFDGQPKPSDAVLENYVDDAAWIAEMDLRRSAIGIVPGEGNILGVWYFNDKVYAFRNNAGSTKAVMWESSASGWVEVGMNYQLDFTGGNNEIQAGDTIEGVTSGATATVFKIFVESGTWGSSDAAGRIYFRPVSLVGNFQAGELLKVSTVDSATNTAQEFLLTFAAGGHYEFVNYNFYGHSGSRTMYGVNGVGNAFIFDGSDMWFINTGMTLDTPNHIFAFKKHLFLSFPGGSVQHSSIGVPDEWSAITGASEIAIGDECVGFELTAGDTLVIVSRNSTKLLYGKSSADWELKSYSESSGAIEWSVQRLANPLYLDDRGLITLQTTQAYGDFKSASISKKIDPLLTKMKGLLLSSVRVRNKDQYRLFFSDKTNITFTFIEGKLIGAMKHDYDKPVLCTCSSETTNGEEVLFFGSDDGYVYQMDSGRNFDGEAINAYVRPAFNHFKSPEHIKRFTKIVLEIDANEKNSLFFVPSYDYGGGNSAGEGIVNVTGGGGYWGDAKWEDFYYDTQVVSSAYGYLQGVGKNFSLYIRSVTQYELPHTLQGVIIHLSIKGLVR